MARFALVGELKRSDAVLQRVGPRESTAGGSVVSNAAPTFARAFQRGRVQCVLVYIIVVLE